MSIKSILAGTAAFVVAGGAVYGFNGKLQTANGAYRLNPSTCIAINSAGCNTQNEEPCLENVDGVGTNLQIYENLDEVAAGQQTTCGDPLFKMI